ncbi:uncharacterized protein LOC111088474 [Limulus polyphemus]|uniref:Uncharacterized protein LOC111088474 n=1 Tax=Limulus polyphemus TaxID=6850 RepID=A0ABM1TEX3_LIMPO|nr:uncharacterized protein LOC111088474 [Limulus polyphemus]
MDHYLISYKTTELHPQEFECSFFDAPMLKKDCFSHFVNLEDLLVDNLESKPLKTVHVQEGNDLENYNDPKKGNILNESLQSQRWVDNELDLSLLEDIEPLVTPTPTTIAEAIIYPQTSIPCEPPSINTSFIMPSVPQSHGFSRIQAPTDNYGFLVETPPDSPVSQVPDVLGFSRILEHPKMYHWDNCGSLRGQTLPNLPSSWNPSPSYSSGAPSPTPSVLHQNTPFFCHSGYADLSRISLQEPSTAGILDFKSPKNLCGFDSFDVSNTSQMEAGKLIQPTEDTIFPRYSEIQESENVVSHGTIFSTSPNYLDLPSTTRRQRTKTKYLQNDYITKILHNETRKDRKKLQNKEAATRYRIKKREEAQWLQDEENVLAMKNRELRNKVKKIKTEITYLKNLTKEILKVNRGFV